MKKEEDFSLLAIFMSNKKGDCRPGFKKINLNKKAREKVRKEFHKQYHDFLKDKDILSYDSFYKPEDDELIMLKPFEKAGLYSDAFDHIVSLPCANMEEDGDGVKGLMGRIKIKEQGEGDESEGRYVYCFQPFTLRNIFRKLGLLSSRYMPEYKPFEASLFSLDSKLCAVIDGSTLMFSSFTAADRIFHIYEHMVEASDSEVIEFISNTNCFAKEKEDDFYLKLFKKTQRKALKKVVATGILDKAQPAYIYEKVLEIADQQENKELFVNSIKLNDDKKFIIPSTSKELRFFLEVLSRDVVADIFNNQALITKNKREVK